MSAIDTAVAAVLAEHSQADTEEVRGCRPRGGTMDRRGR